MEGVIRFLVKIRYIYRSSGDGNWLAGHRSSRRLQSFDRNV